MTRASELPETEATSWATFHLADELFAIAAHDVQEVLSRQPVTPVPLSPPYVAGLVNLRGQVMTAIDLRTRLRLPKRDIGQACNVIVVKIAGASTALMVDAIGDVVELDGASWAPPPETLSAFQRECVFGICPVGDRVLLGLRAASLDEPREIEKHGGSK